MFENQYIGFDALFMDYYTNARFTLDQELEADLFALRIMNDLGIPIREVSFYRNILKICDAEHLEKN
jgi:hypothetical protein